jgi:hypothetical protein
MTVTIKPGVYQHYKGNKYLVLGTATHSETLEKLVVYVTLYDSAHGPLWVRPLAMFAEEVVVDGVKRPRFAWLGDGSGDGSGQ